MKPERVHLSLAVIYVVVGMGLGVMMAQSGDHTQHVTHAHILLIGFVVSALYALIYRVWTLPQGMIAWAQTALHQIGAVVLLPSLYILYGHIAAGNQAGIDGIEPVLAITSLMVLAGAAVMALLVLTKAK
ncbi:MAG: hypothetical protein KIS81_10100 [Maricaulaceae bacterium]|nr:hypothetical protein [Maricaulaceae bacterium]